MRSLSTKLSLAILAAILLVVAVVGIVVEYAHERTQMREHAAAITGGDPVRGEAMFIQYGCGSCHALKNVRTATVTISAPDASTAAAFSSKLLYLPVPTISRDVKVRPATVQVSA